MILSLIMCVNAFQYRIRISGYRASSILINQYDTVYRAMGHHHTCLRFAGRISLAADFARFLASQL